MKIVAQIEQVARIRDGSTHYKKTALALAEWGPRLDGKGWRAHTMALPLLMATVITLGAQRGLRHAHHSIFWDFYKVIQFGLLDHRGKPKPLYHAYALLHQLIGKGRTIMKLGGTDRGKWAGGAGAALATKDSKGTLRMLVLNRSRRARKLQLNLDGKPLRPRTIRLFTNPKQPPRQLTPHASQPWRLPGQSMALLTF